MRRLTSVLLTGLLATLYGSKPGSAATSALCFSDAVFYAAGEGPRSLFAGDLNGDNHADLAVACLWTGSVAILMNSGDGTLSSPSPYAVGNQPAGVIAADFDSDGDLDLAVATRGSDSLVVLTNDGTGTYTRTHSYAAGDLPYSVFAADLDSDGDRDLAVANVLSNNVTIHTNGGGGVFAEAVTYSTGDGPISVIAHDLDGDGDEDLATANIYGHNVSVLKNNGDGTLSTATTYLADSNPSSICTTDLDADGDHDLVCANETGGTVSVLKNNGDGTFAPSLSYPTGSGPYSVSSADLDGDGDADLVVANHGGNTVSVLQNAGDGTFHPAVNFDGGASPSCIIAADFNGTGGYELAVANEAGGNVSVLTNCNRPPRTLRVPQEYLTIQMGIEYSVDGDTILVTEVIPRETLAIDFKAVTITSSTGPSLPELGLITVANAAGHGSVVIDGFTISNGGNGISATLTDLVVKNCAFRQITGEYLSCDGGSLLVEHCLFQPENASGGYGIYVACPATIRRNVFAGGFKVPEVFLGGGDTVDIINNTFYRCDRAIAWYGPQGRIYNNIFSMDGVYSIVQNGGDPVIQYNLFWQSQIVGGMWLNADPQLIGGNPFDYHLRATSPCRDAGYPGSDFIDEDGSRNDIGAYAYTAGNTPPGPVILVSPPAFSLIPAASPVFYWLAAADPDPGDSITYSLVLALDSALEFRTEVVGLTSTLLPLSSDLTPGAHYWWRVTASDGNGGVSTSPVWSFETILPCSCDCHADPICDGVKSDVLDIVSAIGIAFRGASPVVDPNVACPRLPADVNCSGSTDVVDVVKIVNVAFRGANAATEYCEPCSP